ncbi:hypothetical protein [Streptomyces sp. NBC_01500]|uniref:hypothetical protein n=1 Tax=Streptomyces sp. NBC_01500 TaxID=2903886 RepID=UPI0022542899|nr:hypothetical protein [Streptomyces sp. NBC_01500]MCX4554273.1 hypothetical protein [Streptomyces sp. NBC_01500]
MTFADSISKASTIDKLDGLKGRTMSFTDECFDLETQRLLEAVAVDAPEFGDIDLDIAFGTPLEMNEADLLPREQVTSREDSRTEFIDALITADTTRRARLHAAHDINAADPGIARLVRERLVDVLLPYTAQLRITPLASVTPLPLAA